MANLKPFQVIVTFRDRTKQEYGFNTAMERKIYLWGVKDAEGREVTDIDEYNYKPPCMACSSNPVDRTFVRKKEERDKTTRVVVKLCEECSKNVIALGMVMGGEIVSDEEAFGLPGFEDLVKNAGLPG
jgi:hypothetical protein